MQSIYNFIKNYRNSSSKNSNHEQVGAPFAVFTTVLVIRLVLFTVVAFSTVLVTVTDGVGIFEVLVWLIRTVGVESVTVVFLMAVASFRIVEVVPGGVNVDLSVTVAIRLIITVDVGRTTVALSVVRDVVVVRIVWAGNFIVDVLKISFVV